MIRLLVRISNKDVFALYDTGAGVSAISTALCKKLGVKFVDAKQSVFLANGVKLVSSGRANVLVDINGVKKMVVLRVFPKLQHNLIIGLDIIRLFGLEQRKDVREMVYGCRRCEAFKSNAEKTKLPMIPSDVEYTNWNRLGLDICGPLSLSSKGFKYIVVLQDYATKFMVAGAFKDTRTENLVSWLIEIFSMFGWPAVLVCDRGSQFESAMFNKFLADNNIKLNFASVGHHQTNGLAERAIRTVEDMLRTSVLDQADWDVALPKLIAAYNASINFSTKESPFKLLFGHNMSTPLDLKFGIRHEMSDLVELSQKRILANRSAQTLQKFQYDKDVKLEVLEPGDLVLWHQLDRALGSSKKLNKRWRGPFKIRAKEGPNFLIVDNFGNTRWIHHNHLKKVDLFFFVPGSKGNFIIIISIFFV